MGRHKKAERKKELDRRRKRRRESLRLRRREALKNQDGTLKKAK